MIVRESISFERGGTNPFKNIGIGVSRLDKFRLDSKSYPTLRRKEWKEVSEAFNLPYKQIYFLADDEMNRNNSILNDLYNLTQRNGKLIYKREWDYKETQIRNPRTVFFTLFETHIGLIAEIHFSGEQGSHEYIGDLKSALSLDIDRRGIILESISFERHADPLKKLGIGLREQITEWLENYYHDISNATRAGTYTINDDLTIDVDGFFTTDWPGNFPSYIQFNEVKGSFNIQGDLRNNSVGREPMNSLRGCPRIIKGGGFNCSRNNIINLVGGPVEVHGNYACSMNPNFKSFEGLAKYIGGDLSCNNKAGLTEKDIPNWTEIMGGASVHYWSDW